MTTQKIPVEITRKEFLTLPMETRRRILSEEVEEMLKDHSIVAKNVEELTKTGIGKKVKISYISLTKPDLVRATIRGLKTETRRVLTKSNSDIGEGGDWTKLCWDGSAMYKDPLSRNSGISFESKAPLPFRDEGFPDPKTGEKNYQYLHVPYHWAENDTIYRVYSKWEPGQIIGFKESWGVSDFSKKFPGRLQVVYRAGVNDIDHPNGNDADRLWRDVDEDTWQKYASKNQWRGPRFMPSWAVRLWAQVVSVRPERVQEITAEGARAEGIDGKGMLDPYIQNDFRVIWDSINAKRGFSFESNCWVWVLRYRLLTANGLQVA